MRLAMTLTILLGMTATAQQPADDTPAPRFNVLLNPRFFKQDTPRNTLASVVKAGNLGQYDYMAAYLMGEAAGDVLIQARAAEVEAAAETDLRARRAEERADPFKPAPMNALPLDPVAFTKRVQNEAMWRGWYQLVREVRERFTEDPSNLRELQRYLRDGDLTETETTAKLIIPAEKGKAIHFKKVGARWFLEDRTQDVAAPAAGSP